MYTVISYSIDEAVKGKCQMNVAGFSGCSIVIEDSGIGRPVIRASKDGYVCATVYAPIAAPLEVATYV